MAEQDARLLSRAKLRNCAHRPELALDAAFRGCGWVELRGTRRQRPIWPKEIRTGEKHTAFRLAQIERHLFEVRAAPDSGRRARPLFVLVYLVPLRPGVRARRRRHRDPRDAVVPGRPGLRTRHGEVHQPHRRRGPAAAQQRRHRPDHPGRLPQAGHPHRLRGRPLRRLAQRPVVRAEPRGVRRGLGPGGRPRLRHRLVARARRVGAAELRVQGGDLAALRRHLPRQLRQVRPASPRRSTRRSCSGCGTTSRPTRAPA